MSSDAIDLDALTVKQLLALQVRLLVDLRDAMIESVASDSEECVHPEDRRVSLATLGDPDHWVCLDCRKDNKLDAMH